MEVLRKGLMAEVPKSPAEELSTNEGLRVVDEDQNGDDRGEA